MQVTEKTGPILFIPFEAVNEPGFLRDLQAGGRTGRDAFAVLVRATHDRYLGYIRRHLRSPEEAQEVLQDTFLAVYRSIGSFEGKSKLSTWMYSLAHFKICDRIADRNRGHASLDAVAEPVHAESESWSRVTAWESAPDKVLERRTAEFWIAQAVEALASPGREVYQLRDVEGLSGEEIAEVTGLSHAAVRVQLHRARSQIVASVRERMAAVATRTEGPARPASGEGHA